MKEDIQKMVIPGAGGAQGKDMPSNEFIMDKFKQQKLPLARIKKIMKSDEEVRVSNQFLYCFNFNVLIKF